MGEVSSLEDIRTVLLKARNALVKTMIKDPKSQIHWIDFTPAIFHEIDAAISACDRLAASSHSSH